MNIKQTRYERQTLIVYPRS